MKAVKLLKVLSAKHTMDLKWENTDISNMDYSCNNSKDMYTPTHPASVHFYFEGIIVHLLCCLGELVL